MDVAARFLRAGSEPEIPRASVSRPDEGVRQDLVDCLRPHVETTLDRGVCPLDGLAHVDALDHRDRQELEMEGQDRHDEEDQYPLVDHHA